jgi:hypothetical protein
MSTTVRPVLKPRFKKNIYNTIIPYLPSSAALFLPLRWGEAMSVENWDSKRAHCPPADDT